MTDTEKAQVSNRLALVEARELFEEVQGKIVFENAKKAYQKLNHVSELCASGMDDIYGAWYYGIYKAKDSASFYSFSKETPNFDSTELQKAADDLGISSYSLKSDWQYALYIVERALKNRGDYTTVETEMAEAQTILQELTKTYSDYTYYPKLKDYYASVSAYVEFFKSPTGSFKQLSDTINTYENNIRTYKSDVGFLFNES